MSGKSGSPLVILAIRLRLISSLTDSHRYPLAFSSPRVRGRSITIAALSGSNQIKGSSRTAHQLKQVQVMLGSRPREVNAACRNAPRAPPFEGPGFLDSVARLPGSLAAPTGLRGDGPRCHRTGPDFFPTTTTVSAAATINASQPPTRSGGPAIGSVQRLVEFGRSILEDR